MVLGIIIGYFCFLLGLGIFGSRLLKLTSGDYFLASRGIGPFMLLMSIFGTTMTAFALVGSTGATYKLGIGIYGKMASWSGIVHSAVFFLIGAKVWAIGKEHGYMTQLSYLRDRYQSNSLPLVLFPILVGFVTVYILMGVMGGGAFLEALLGKDVEGTPNMPKWLGMLTICGVVMFYVFWGGMRATAWANTIQTLVFMGTGVVAFYVITKGAGGVDSFFEAASKATDAVANSDASNRMTRARIGKGEFATYFLIPLSVGMFPHLFQHWLTAKKASNFKLTVIAHPVCILITWLPCCLIGMWAAGILPAETPSNAVLAIMVKRFSSSEVLRGILGAGVLAAIMSSMDSQFLCISSMFTNDIVVPHCGKDKYSEKQRVWMGRIFVVIVVAACYIIGLISNKSVFKIGVWCFSGFSSLVPIVVAALYWKRSNRQGVIASAVSVAVLWLGGLAFVFSDTLTEQVFGGKFLIAGLHPVTALISVSTVVLIAVTLMTSPPDEGLVEKFFGAQDSESE
ncbi:MAG: sodium:solute symporter family protein [Planctomycetota bacterium]|jgi:SSS family solute:Na+ symporter|nr:sodium:solute symporter family protein [Planctomycetota bacterium]MDP7249319.1 sodium:solute symporter family protein [Planctomycetota bacterium]